MHAMVVAVTLLLSAPLVALSAQGSVDSAAAYFDQAVALNKLNAPRQSLASLVPLRRSLALYRERRDSAGEAKVMYEIGLAHRRANQEDSAKIVMLQAKELFRTIGDHHSEGLVLFELGVAEPRMVSGRSAEATRAVYREARNYVLEAGRIWLADGDTTHRAEVLAAAGLWWLVESPDSALAYTARALQIARAVRDTTQQLMALNRTSAIYMRLFQRTGETPSRQLASRDSAYKYLRLAIDLGRASGAAEHEAFSIGDVIRIYSEHPFTPQAHEPDTIAAYSRRLLELARMNKATDRREEITVLLRASSQFRNVQVDTALTYAREAVALARRHADSTLLYNSLMALQQLEVRLGWADSALMRIREISGISAKVNPSAQLFSMGELARAHASRGFQDSVEFYYRRILTAADSIPGISPATRAAQKSTATSGLFVHFLRVNRPDSAMQYVRPADPDSLQTSYRLVELGRIQLARGFPDSAAAHFSHAVALARRSAAQQAIATSWLVTSDLAVDRLDSAITRGRRVLSHFTKINRDEEANALSQLSVAYARLGQPDTAIALYRNALALWERTGDRSSLANGLGRVAGIFRNADIQDSAFVYGRRALDVQSRMDSPLARAPSLQTLGVSYASVGQLDSAAVYFDQAARLNRQYARDAALVTNLSNLAFTRLRASRTADDSTFALLRESMSLAQRTQNRRDEGSTRQYLARALVMRGQPDSALAQGRVAVRMLRETGYRAFEGRALAEIGGAFVALGRPDSAQLYFAQAIRIMRAEGFTVGVRMTLARMAELYRDGTERNLERAVAYYDSAAATVERARRSAGNDESTVALAEGEVDLFSGWARAWAGRVNEVGPERSAAAALGAVERGRSQALQDLLSQLLPQATRRAVTPPAIGGDLAVETDSLLAPLRASRQAALSYLHAGDTLFTWIVAPDGKVSLHRASLPASELALLVRSSRRAFDADDARSAPLDPDELGKTSAADSIALTTRDARADLSRLAELLLPAELETLVPVGTPIVVVPHGTIGLVPFAALEPRADKGAEPNADRLPASRTLGARHALRFAPSFAALRATEARPRTLAGYRPVPNGERGTGRADRSTTKRPSSSSGAAGTATRSRQLAQALVVGNPTMPSVYSGRWATRSQLQSLPGAEAEGRSVAAQLGARALIGKGATETMVRTRLATATVVHFATHGLAYGTASAARRSYVAFAPDAKNDGLLTLGELMDDPALVMQAELVVLSACQTGLGNLKQAEGTIGLQRAFLARGARSVLVSLWNVDDAATRLLMERFYTYWLGSTSRTKADALQLAQRDVRSQPQYAHPKYWAGFQLVGAQ